MRDNKLTIRQVLDRNDEEALKLAYKLAAKIWEHPLSPEQRRKMIEEERWSKPQVE